MPRIRIGVQGKVATNLMPDEKVVCRNGDYELEFEFDDGWRAHELKTALVVYNGGSVAVPFSGTVCALPKIYNANMFAVGVFAGDLVTTTPAQVPCEKSIADLAKYEIEEPTADVYNQLVQMIESGMLKGEAGKSVLYYAGDFGKENLDDHLASVADMSEKPMVGDLVITRDGVLCEVNKVFDEHACMLSFLSSLRGEKGEKGDAGSIRFIMVSVLPIDGIDPTAIYLVPQVGSVEGNMYDEFIYADGVWEKLGGLTVNIDHSEYVKFTDYASLNKAGVVKGAGEIYGISIDGNGMISLAMASQSEVKQKLASKALLLHQIDLATKEGVTNNNIELTDEEKASACAWLGAVKRNSETSNMRRAYAIGTKGEQILITIGYSNDASNQSLVMRDTYGAIYVPDTAIDRQNNIPEGEEAINRNYVNHNFLKKLSNVTSDAIVTQKPDGTTDRLSFSADIVNYYLVRRDANGDVLVNDTPVNPKGAVNRNYVDGKIGDIETVLDGIIAIQNSLIGGSV